MSVFPGDHRLQGSSFPSGAGYSRSEAGSTLLLEEQAKREEWERLVRQRALMYRLQTEVPNFFQHVGQVASEETRVGPVQGDVVWDEDQGEYVHHNTWIRDRHGELKLKPAKETAARRVQQRLAYEDGPEPLRM